MKKIIVIDDDGSNLEVIALVLEHAGYEVHTYFSGKNFLKNVAALMPDLIILDIILNGEDGRDLCKMIKNSNAFKSIPTLMISIGDKRHLIDDCLADGYIEKPFAIEDLASTVNSYLRQN